MSFFVLLIYRHISFLKMNSEYKFCSDDKKHVFDDRVYPSFELRTFLSTATKYRKTAFNHCGNITKKMTEKIEIEPGRRQRKKKIYRCLRIIKKYCSLLNIFRIFFIWIRIPLINSIRNYLSMLLLYLMFITSNSSNSFTATSKRLKMDLITITLYLWS